MFTNRAETVLRELLSNAGIEINGGNPQDIQVHNPRFYQRVLNENVLGLGESYMDGWWDCESIDQMVDLALRADLERRIKGNWKLWWPVLQSKLLNLQTSRRAYQVGEEHYDLGNDLYAAMLDKRLNYTCGYWRDAQDLDAAQEAKLDLVCRKIQLEPGMTVLELGCGFGAFAKFAAEKYGARVTGVTVSRQQVELGMKMSAGLPVELKLQDYRLVEGTYDRVISIGVWSTLVIRITTPTWMWSTAPSRMTASPLFTPLAAISATPRPTPGRPGTSSQTGCCRPSPSWAPSWKICSSWKTGTISVRTTITP